MSLVGYWKLDGDAKDSVSGNHGTVNGASTVPGKLGDALDFDGSGDSITFGDIGITTHQFSMSTWVNLDDHTDSSGQDSTIGLHVDDGTNGYRTFLDGQDLAVWVRNNGSANYSYSNFSMPLNEWVHVVLTYDGNVVRLYANGDEVVSNSVSATPIRGSGYIGRYSGGGYNLDGKANDVRLYDHAISEKKIRQLSQAKVLHYKFNQDGPVAADGSGYGNDGAINGPTYTTDSKVGSGAYDFSGSNGIRIPNNPTVQLVDDLTISFWAKPFAISSARQNPINKSYSEEFTMTAEKGGNLSFYCNDSDSAYNNYQGHNIFQNDNEWVHVTAVRDVGNEVVWYRNGEYWETKPWNGGDPIAGGDDLIIGDGYTNPYNGILDDVRLYASALSADEVKEVYEQRASIDAGGNFHSHEIGENGSNGVKLKSTGTLEGDFSEVGPGAESLVGWWPLDGDTRDYAGENDAYVNSGSPSTTSGLGQSSYQFNERTNGDQLKSDKLKGVNPDEITMSAWINPNNSTDSRSPIFRGGGDVYFQHYSNDRIATYWYGWADTGYHYSTAGSVPTNAWSHVVVTWNGNTGEIKFYVNGSLDRTISGVGNGGGDPATSDALIGRESTNRRFDGKIQDVRVYNRALTATETETLYNLTDPRQDQRVIQSADGSVYSKNEFDETL